MRLSIPNPAWLKRRKEVSRFEFRVSIQSVGLLGAKVSETVMLSEEGGLPPLPLIAIQPSGGKRPFLTQHFL